MTSLSRRKRPTTAPPTTPRRTILTSLFGLAWLAAGPAAAQTPSPLRPLAEVPAIDFRDPPPVPSRAAPLPTPIPLVPVTKPPAPAAPAFTAPKSPPPPAAPAVQAAPPAPPAAAPARTYLFQKDPTPSAPARPPVQEMVFQQQPGLATDSSIPLPPSATRTTPPGINEIGVKSDQEIAREIREEVRTLRQPEIFAAFPTNYTPLSTVAYSGRQFQPADKKVEPFYVCYRRLYFEEKNSERYGWEIGPLQPLLSAATFYGDLLKWPYNIGTRPCQRYECDAGYCLPGDPVPYLLYPMELSVTGGLLEAGTIVGLYAIFP